MISPDPSCRESGLSEKEERYTANRDNGTDYFNHFDTLSVQENGGRNDHYRGKGHQSGSNPCIGMLNGEQ
jgi:hypothetical protein